MIRQIKTPPVVGDTVKLKKLIRGSTWSMKVVEILDHQRFIGELVFSDYPGDEGDIGRLFKNEWLRDYFKV